MPKTFKGHKWQSLFIGILMDAGGLVTFLIPVLGEWLDVIWAPFSAFVMSKMYAKTHGNWSSWLAFAEEALPWADFVPSFTLMWLYAFVFKAKKTEEKWLEQQQEKLDKAD
jgi:hypothetical protein